jgi:hypothetical protein
VKTSSVSFRSAMRPEYLAEFEAAGVAPPSDLLLWDQVEAFREPAARIQQSAIRKVILAGPELSGNAIAVNLAAVAVGTLKLLLWAMMIAIGIYLAMITGFIRASRKR